MTSRDVRRVFAVLETEGDHKHVRFMGVIYRNGIPGKPEELMKPWALPSGLLPDVLLGTKGLARVEPWTKLSDGSRVAEVGVNYN